MENWIKLPEEVALNEGTYEIKTAKTIFTHKVTHSPTLLRFTYGTHYRKI